MRGSSAPGDITSFTLSHVRLSVLGSCARYFQKLFTSGTLRVFLMSSKTARPCGEASAYSIGGGDGMNNSKGYDKSNCEEPRYKRKSRRSEVHWFNIQKPVR